MTTAVTNTQSTAATTAATAKSKSTDIQDRFLKLLVTQMQNQDPLNPMDNAQVTSQMAQISTVTGIDKLGVSMGDLGGMLQAAKTTQATTMIGRNVFAEGNVMNYDSASGQGVAGFNLASKASSVKVEVLDQGGAVMQTQTYDNVPAGINNFSWDGALDKGGTAESGKYQFRITATQGTQAVEATTLSVGRVNSVSLAGGVATLNVAGLGAIDLDAVQQVL